MQKLTESKKAQMTALGIAAIATLVTQGLSPEMGAQAIAAIVIAYNLGQAIVDAFRKDNS